MAIESDKHKLSKNSRILGSKSNIVKSKPHYRWFTSMNLFICSSIVLLSCFIRMEHIIWLLDHVISSVHDDVHMNVMDHNDDVVAMKQMIDQKLPPPMSGKLFNISSINTSMMLSWQKDIHDILSVISYHHPVIIKGFPTHNWSMFNHEEMDFLRLIQHSIILNETRWQINDPTFILGHERDRGGMLGSKHDRPLHYVNITLDQFIASALDNTTYLYWTGELSSLEHHITSSSSSSSSKNEWESFRIIDDTLHDSLNLKDDVDIWKPMLWLSHPGVVSQTHYDTQHNIFLQVYGKKRFLLFPPESELYSYPNIHRSYRQSQAVLSYDHHIDNDAYDYMMLSKYPKLHGLHAMEVILSPGDILYIPPYHYHRVESLSLSMSMSVLSPSGIEAKLAVAYWRQVPFSKFQEKTIYRTAAIKLYLSSILHHIQDHHHDDIHHVMNISIFAWNLYQSRYEPLYNIVSLQELYESLPGMKHLCDEPHLDDHEYHMRLNSTTSLFEESAAAVAIILHDISSATGGGRGIAMTFLKDYMEQLIRWAVGPDKVAVYLSQCLSNHQKVS